MVCPMPLRRPCVPWAVACGADTVRARRITRGRSRCIACTPEVARPYGFLGIMPFVRSPRTPGIPYLRLLLFVQKCHAKVSALELRFLVDQGARREFTQFLPQPPQVHTNSARNSSVPARFRTSEKECVPKRLLFPSLLYRFWIFFPPSRFQECTIRFVLTSALKASLVDGWLVYTPRSGQLDPGCHLLPSSCCRVEEMGISIRSE